MFIQTVSRKLKKMLYYEAKYSNFYLKYLWKLLWSFNYYVPFVFDVMSSPPIFLNGWKYFWCSLSSGVITLAMPWVGVTEVIWADYGPESFVQEVYALKKRGKFQVWHDPTLMTSLCSNNHLLFQIIPCAWATKALQKCVSLLATIHVLP